MIDEKQVLQDLTNLPPSAQQMIVDFISFLQDKYAANSQEGIQKPESGFIGMWQDREEMIDSSDYVRQVATDTLSVP